MKESNRLGTYLDPARKLKNLKKHGYDGGFNHSWIPWNSQQKRSNVTEGSEGVGACSLFGGYVILHFMVVCLVDCVLPHYWKANEVHDVKDADKRTFKTKQYKQN